MLLNNALLLLAICLGFKGFIRVWKQQAKTDAIVLLLFYLVIIVYLNPFMSSSKLTIESLGKFIYGPISDYMINILKIRMED
ncbi:hypothetical protein QFZ77_003321 [Paenibacillus sp. V4I3]|uniref:hypothetical protein n=1 Tax=Paenibacillus sp. V4I3 TaxID=3042305 RepID=UPI00277DCE67|nr:hypothetical protein [Paenibacillus sp. V4I3]MDQ0874662.1 hypothetical protein [Paenibacillus sp. V4I3]MDQ0889585.1 hypothetical protein [Paenibacillus sp. V4I9]